MDVAAVVQAIAVAQSEFEIVLADTPALRREAFRLRHQVYCVERGFEAVEGDEETDEFDSRARHVLLRYVPDGTAVGTVRVVPGEATSAGLRFPMQSVCDPHLLKHLPITCTGEISRFAISKARRMTCTSAVLLRLSLMRGIVQVSGQLGLTHWCAVMERSLLRLLQVSAIHFQPVGPLVSYHGVRQPSTGAIGAVLGRMRREKGAVWDYVTGNGSFWNDRSMPMAA